MKKLYILTRYHVLLNKEFKVNVAVFDQFPQMGNILFVVEDGELGKPEIEKLLDIFCYVDGSCNKWELTAVYEGERIPC